MKKVFAVRYFCPINDPLPGIVVPYDAYKRLMKLKHAVYNTYAEADAGRELLQRIFPYAKYRIYEIFPRE